MKRKVLEELVSVTMAILPILYLVYSWNVIPDNIPLHYNLAWEPDRWGSKDFLIPLSIFPIIVYASLYFILKAKSESYYLVKLISLAIVAFTIIHLIHTITNGSEGKLNYNFLFIGIITIVMGQLMKSLKANYFIGVRTPWTLGSETVWRDTHYFSSRIFLIAGLAIIILSLFLPVRMLPYSIIAIISIIVLVTVGYSYYAHKTNEGK